MDSQSDHRSVALTVPSDPDFLVLARLALSGVCRLTPLSAEDVVDLKLAITEAATGVCHDGDATVGETVSFNYCLEDDRLVLDVTGATRPSLSPEERELGRAIVDATVDAIEPRGETVRLVKRLPSAEDG